MHDIVMKLGDALLMAFGMFWQTAWALVLGFTISSTLQATVSTEAIQKALGKDGPKQIALASVAGAASSSCSYASAAIMRTLFKKGAALANALAFLFASTNLVLELGVILLLLMGWQFAAGEWIGGVVLIAIMSVVVKLTYPQKLAEAARSYKESSGGHEHMTMVVEGATWRERVGKPETRIRVAQNFAMEWSMLWKDLLIGFLVGGMLAAFVPDAFWKTLFLADAPGWIQAPANAVIGPIVAVLTFVCSIGNVPLAAILWTGGASFGGVLAFLYADLIVLPLLDAYRRYFGWKMAAYIGGVLFATMAVAALIMDLAFSALGWIPSHDMDVRARMTEFSLNYTFWLNMIFGFIAIWLFVLARRHPMDHSHHSHDHSCAQSHDAHGHDHRGRGETSATR